MKEFCIVAAANMGSCDLVRVEKGRRGGLLRRRDSGRVSWVGKRWRNDGICRGEADR